MADEKNPPPAIPPLAPFFVAHFLEFGIPHGQDLVNDQNLRLQMSGHRKSQAHTHPAGVALDRSVNKFFHAGKLHYLVKFLVNLRFPHSKNRAIEINILAPRQIWVESGPHLQQAAHSAKNLRPATSWLRDSG